MTIAQVLLLVWPVVVLVAFWRLEAHRACIIAIIGGWIALPTTTLMLSGWTWTKMEAAVVPSVIGTLIFCRPLLKAYRPSMMDLPAVLFCLCPFIAALVNRLPLTFASTETGKEMLYWLAPFALGRLLIGEPKYLRDLGVGVLLAGLIYVPLCWLEIFRGPVLNQWLTGEVSGRAMAGAWRGGTWRPVVLMSTGFEVTMMLALASMLGVWMWRAGTIRRIAGVPVLIVVAALVVTTIMARSLGSILLMGVGLGLLFVIARTRWRGLLLGLIVLIPLYAGLRLSGLMSGHIIVRAFESVAPNRAHSLQFRLEGEDQVIRRLHERPLFGWGAFNAWREDEGRRLDGFWIMALTRTGIVSLVIWMVFMLLPSTRFVMRTPGERWADVALAAPSVFAVFLVLWTVDGLINYEMPQAYILLLGAMTALAVRRGRSEDAIDV
ncbi:MAG: hypothetical protein GC162_11245 [Planctomycetes bacterium]|nr:hypothetical protein [Planctomycetota bacterium]